MSDTSPADNHPETEAQAAETVWQPMAVDGLDKIHPPSISADGVDPPAPVDSPPEQDAPGNFQVLYSRVDDSQVPGGFVSMIHQEEEDASAPETDTAEEERPAIEEIEQEAYEQGFAKGEKEGYDVGLEQAKEIGARMQTILEEMEGLWERLVRAHEKQLVELVYRAAERVVCGCVAVDRTVVGNVILNALEMIPEPVNVTLHVNPDDYDYIETIKEDFFERVKTLRNISVVSDPAVSAGGCKIQSASGGVDATLESRLEAILHSIREAAGTPPPLESRECIIEESAQDG